MVELVIAFLLALFFSYCFRQSLIDSMSNVHVAQEAKEYLKRDTVNIKTIIDTYLFTTITAIPKVQEDDDDQNDDDDSDEDSDDDSDNDSDDDSDNDSDDDSGDSDDGGDSDDD